MGNHNHIGCDAACPYPRLCRITIDGRLDFREVTELLGNRLKFRGSEIPDQQRE
jgi:hypothetical protein